MKPLIHIASCSFGKDSIATILLALEHNEPLDRVVFAEVMFDKKRNISGEIPEVIQWIYNIAIPKLESLGVIVDVVRADNDYISICSRAFKTPKIGKSIYYGVQNSRPCYANTYLKLHPIKNYYKIFKSSYDIVQYVGIAVDEPVRLARLVGTNKVSLLQKYGYTEEMAMAKCIEYGLVNPCYRLDTRGGCWFCFNANVNRYIHMRECYPSYWEAFRTLYHTTESKYFVYNKSLKDVENEMDAIVTFRRLQYRLFD